MGHTVALTSAPESADGAAPPGVHGSPINPLVGVYPTADDRYISFVMMQPTKFWADVCRHMDLEDCIDDPRFATVEAIAENTAAAVEILSEAMAKRTLPEWSEAVRHAGRTVGAGAGHPAGGRATPRSARTSTSSRRASSELVANPVQFDVSAPQTGPAPGFAEQTDEILLELGFDWDRIIELKTAGAVT